MYNMIVKYVKQMCYYVINKHIKLKLIYTIIFMLINNKCVIMLLISI